MISYIIRRVGVMIPMLIGISLVSFFVIQLAPGSPTDLMTDLNPKASDLARQRLHVLYGLDKPIIEQYWNWLQKLATLDFGVSFAPDGRPVLEKILERLPITIIINVLSLLLTLAVALPLGVHSAVHRGSIVDKITTIIVFIGFAAPTFWLALLGIMFFGVHLGWLPVSGIKSLNHNNLSFVGQVWDYARHLFLPVMLSSFVSLAGISRYMRANMLEVISQNYITTARAKGLSEQAVIYVHALRNALMPIITILGLSIPGLIGGSVIFESIFAIPGMGKLFYDGVMARDYPLIMGNLVLGGVLTLFGNLMADIGYALTDPRVRRE